VTAPYVPHEILRLVEAFVFASSQPVTADVLRPLLPEPHDPRVVLAALQRQCAERGIVLVETGGGWMFTTAPDLAAALGGALPRRRRLSRAATETLAGIALHQPVTRAEIEQVRGVALSQATMDTLLEAGLIQPEGRRDGPGRPTLWATTPRFLTQFGLRSLRDLPGAHLAAARPETTRAHAGGDQAPDAPDIATSSTGPEP